MLLKFEKIWNRTWFKPFDAYSVAIFRIGVGLLCLAMYLCLSPNWNRFFAADGILSLTSGNRALSEDHWSLFYLIDGVLPVSTLLCLGVLASISFTVGFKTRISTILLYVLQTSMIHRTRFVVNGEDLVMRMLLFYACFAPLGLNASVDAWLDQKKGIIRPEPLIWPVRLMQINLALIYAFSLPIKLSSDDAWLNGDLMYFVLISDTWSRWPWHSLLYNGILSKIMTYVAIATEGLFPLLVWFKPIRIYVVCMAIFFHVTIAIILKNVTFFSLAMACGLIVFIPGDSLRSMLAPLKAKFSPSLLA